MLADRSITMTRIGAGGTMAVSPTVAARPRKDEQQHDERDPPRPPAEPVRRAAAANAPRSASGVSVPAPAGAGPAHGRRTGGTPRRGSTARRSSDAPPRTLIVRSGDRVRPGSAAPRRGSGSRCSVSRPGPSSRARCSSAWRRRPESPFEEAAESSRSTRSRGEGSERPGRLRPAARFAGRARSAEPEQGGDYQQRLAGRLGGSRYPVAAGVGRPTRSRDAAGRRR